MTEPKETPAPIVDPRVPPQVGGSSSLRITSLSGKEAAEGTSRKKKRPLTDEERREREVNRKAQHQLISHWRMDRKGSHERADDSASAPKIPRVARPLSAQMASIPSSSLSHITLASLSAPSRPIFAPPLELGVARPALPPLLASGRLDSPTVMEPRISVTPPAPPPLLPPLFSPSSLFTQTPSPRPALPAPRASSVPPPEREVTLDSLAKIAALAPPAVRASPSPTPTEQAQERRKPS